jgi:hypothetical protein
MRGGVEGFHFRKLDSERESSVGETSQHPVQHRLALRETDTFCSEEFFFLSIFNAAAPLRRRRWQLLGSRIPVRLRERPQGLMQLTAHL